MKPTPINIADLISGAVQRAGQRWQMLMMLAILYGAVSSIINDPAYAILEAFSAAANSTANQGAGAEPVDFSAELEILQSGFPTLIWVYLAATALSALLLVPWARATASGDFTPGQGDAAAHARRFARSFSHFITATLLTAAALVLGGAVITMLASLIGFLATPLVFAGGLALIWISIILNAVANYAVLYEAQDKPIGFTDAWRKFRPVFIPLSASLAVFIMVSIIASFIVTGLFGVDGLNMRLVDTALKSALGFSASALHISALVRYTKQG